ncbi:hypothetical protein ACFL1K_05425 [Candidatus Omnitrophota bacterium]
MVNKDELLRDLNKYIEFEEDVVKQLTDFYLALSWKKYVSESDQGMIQAGLETLKKDSQKHVNLVGEMVKYIEGSGKNEF